MADEARPTSNIDVSYSTFWNDFSHYSFYGNSESNAKGVDSPIAYNSHAEEDMLFADKDKFIDAPNTDVVSFRGEPVGLNMLEKFNCKSMDDGHFCAHIPQDFNVDIRTTGHISGINPGESKLLSLTTYMESLRGGITARRLKADKCSLIGGTHV